MTRKGYAGAAVATTITSNITNSGLSIPIAVATGWPTGASGAQPFVVVIERGTPAEEKVLVSQRSGTTLTVSSRGYDDTVGVSHTLGASIEHCIDAATLSEANAHVNDTSRDDHTQYINNARHDIVARHTFGGAYGTPSAPSSVGTANSAGSGDNPAKEDHVHAIGAGAITSAAAFAAGVVDAAAIATDGVTAAEIAGGAVGSSELASDAVTTIKILDANVTAAKLATDSVTTIKIVDANVTAAKLATNSVTTVKITDANVTRAKLDTTVLPMISCTSGTRPSSPVKGQEICETDTNRIYVWDGTAWQLRGDLRGLRFMARSTATPTTLTPNGAYTKVAFPTEVFDPTGVFASDTFTAPVAATYRFDGRVGAVPLSGGGNTFHRFVIALYKNGVEELRGNDLLYADQDGLGASNILGLYVGGILSLAASDTIDVRMFHNNGLAFATFTESSTANYFSGHLEAIA